MPLSSKAASTASELPPAAEDWILVAQRNALFDGIIRGDSLSLLIKFADNLFGSRAKAMTALEQAELEIYAKIKNKADNAQLKKLVERVRELEKKQKDEKNRKTTRDDAAADGALEPVHKKARTSRKIVPDLGDSDDDMPVASLTKRRSRSRPDDEPVRAKPAQQPRTYQRPRVNTAIDDGDDIGYNSSDVETGLKVAMEAKAKEDAELRRRVLRFERKLDGDPRRSSNSNIYASRKENARPHPDESSSDEDEDEGEDNAGQPFQKRFVSIHNQKAPGQSIVRPADQPRNGRRGALRAPAERVPKSAIRRAPAIQGDPNESNALAYRRAEVIVQARENQHLDDRGRAPDSPPLSPRRAPAGRQCQDCDATDDEAYVPRDADGRPVKYVYRDRRRHRVIRAVPRYHQDDGTWALADEEEDMELLSDNDERDMGIDKPSETKIKLNGWNGMPWDKKWDPVPDPEPRGSAALAVPAGEALLRRSLGVLELSRHEGMEDGTGSEYIHAEGRRSLVPELRGRGGRAHGSYRASPSLAGSVAGGARSVAGGSNMGPPPSTINTVSARYSVREGRMVERTDSKHERGITRTTSVTFMGVDHDKGVQRSLAQRLGLSEEGTPLEESIEQDFRPSNRTTEQRLGIGREDGHIESGHLDYSEGRYKKDSSRYASRPQGKTQIGPLTVDNVAQLEKETGHPRTINELIQRKLRPDGADPKARGDAEDAESVYPASEGRNDFGGVLHQTYRTREETDARQRAAYAAETEQPKAAADDQSRPVGGDSAMAAVTRRVDREPTREELDAEERERHGKTQLELETLGSLFVPSNASSAFGALDDYPERAGSVAGISIGRRPEQRTQGGYAQRGNSNFNNSCNGGGSNRGSQRVGYRGNQRGGWRGGRGGRGGGSQRGRSGYSIPAWFKG